MASKESSPWSARVLYLVTPKFINGDTVFISGPEIVLNGFDNIGFDILLLLEDELSSVDQLAVLVVGKIWSCAWCSSSFGDLFGESESGDKL